MPKAMSVSPTQAQLGLAVMMVWQRLSAGEIDDMISRV
jgi:hypothetical protein